MTTREERRRDNKARWAARSAPPATPFVPGNNVSLRHGAFSPIAIEPVATELISAVLSDPSLAYLQEPRFKAEVEAWARAEATILLIKAYLDSVGGPIDDQGEERPAVRVLERAESRAATGRRELGMSPLAAARLGRDIAIAQAAQAGTLDHAWFAREQVYPATGSVVYFVRRESYVKIGVSARLDARLKALRWGGTKMPDGVPSGPIELLGTMPGDRDTEREMHERFADDRVAGEWFHLTPQIEAFITGLAHGESLEVSQ